MAFREIQIREDRGIWGMKPGVRASAMSGRKDPVRPWEEAMSALLASLASPDPGRYGPALRKLETEWDLAYIRPLQRLYREVKGPEARSRVVRAHRRIGMNGYRVRPAGAMGAIRRSTREGRLAEIDAYLFGLLRAAGSGSQRHGSVNTALLRRTTEKRMILLDEAASDGTTSFDLARGCMRELGDDGPGLEVHSADLASYFHEMKEPGTGTRAILDIKGEVRQLRIEDRLYREPAGPGEDAIPPQVARKFQVQWASMRPAERAQLRVSWINPEAAFFAKRHPGRLIFTTHDLFHAYSRPVPLIRACGILYHKSREDADSPSYFDEKDILKGLLSIGKNLVPGGVAVVGSVVDYIDGVKTYCDFDVWQRTAATLRRVHTEGMGLPMTADCMYLDPGSGVDRTGRIGATGWS